MYVYTPSVPLPQVYLRCTHLYVCVLSFYRDTVKLMNRIPTCCKLAVLDKTYIVKAITSTLLGESVF